MKENGVEKLCQMIGKKEKKKIDRINFLGEKNSKK